MKIKKLFGGSTAVIDTLDIQPDMKLSDIVALVADDNIFNFDVIDNAYQFSLSEKEIDYYSSRIPTSGAQRDAFETTIENNRDFTYNASDKTYSTLNDAGIEISYISVDSKLGSTFLEQEKFQEYAKLGSVVHSILRNINLEGKQAKSLDKEKIYNENKEDLDKFFSKKEDVYPIIDYLADYVDTLRYRGSVLLSEVTLGDKKAVYESNMRNRVADTIDLLEITKEGKNIIHSLQPIILSRIDKKNQTSALEQDYRMKYYAKKLSADSKLAQLAGLKIDKLQVVPMFLQKEDKELEGGIIPVRIKGFNFPITLDYGINAEQAKEYEVTYNRSQADRIVNTKLTLQQIKTYRDWETDRKSTRLNSSHSGESRMPSSA